MQWKTKLHKYTNSFYFIPFLILGSTTDQGHNYEWYDHKLLLQHRKYETLLSRHTFAISSSRTESSCSLAVNKQIKSCLLFLGDLTEKKLVLRDHAAIYMAYEAKFK